MLTFCDPLSLCCECLLIVTRDFYFGRSSPRFPSVRFALYSGTHFFFHRVRRGYYELQRFTFQFWNYSNSDSTSSNDTNNFLRKSLCSSMTQEKDSRIQERKKVVNAINRDFGETVASLSNLLCCFPFSFFCLWREGSNVFPFSLGNTKRMLWSDWLSKLGHSCPLEIARFDSVQEKHCVERTYKLRKFWTVSAMESQKTAKGSQNREEISDSCGFIALQTQLSFFPGSRNKWSFLILNKAKYFCCIMTLFQPSLFDQDGWILASFFL